MTHICVLSLWISPHSTYIQPQRSSLWTSPTKPNMQTPVPGLVRWCTQAPISQAISSKHPQNGETSNLKSISTEQGHKTEQLWSRLHLSVLQTVMDFPNLPGANQLELITLADMNRIVKDIVALIREAKNKSVLDEPYGSECLEASVDRVIQVLQVSLATGAFRCSLGKISIDRVQFHYFETDLISRGKKNKHNSGCWCVCVFSKFRYLPDFTELGRICQVVAQSCQIQPNSVKCGKITIFGRIGWPHEFPCLPQKKRKPYKKSKVKSSIILAHLAVMPKSLYNHELSVVVVVLGIVIICGQSSCSWVWSQKLHILHIHAYMHMN